MGNHLAETTVHLSTGVELKGFLEWVADPLGLIIFVHGSGSSRFSPRNNQVAQYLRSRGFATLLMDFLTTREDQIDAITRELRFDMVLLGQRVSGVLDWLAAQEDLPRTPIGLFGASTGAAAALIAAACQPTRVRAIVSRGGRPDLAGDALMAVHAPTLLIVGGEDLQVLRLNELAMKHIPAKSKLITIEGATHLFEEPGALESVAERAADWFEHYLCYRRAKRRATHTAVN